MNGVVYGREDERFRDTDKLTNTITAMNILKKCTFSTLQTNTVDTPFFNPDIDNKVTIDRMSMSTKDNAVITELANTLRFPPSFTRMYELLDSDEREFTYHNFTFFNINEMKRRRDIFKTKVESTICDVATAYLGMGHVVVLSWSHVNKIFLCALMVVEMDMSVKIIGILFVLMIRVQSLLLNKFLLLHFLMCSRGKM